MTRFAHLPLPDGRLLAYRIRSSARNRNLCLRISVEGLTVSAPRWLGFSEIEAMVAGKSAWITERLEHLARMQNLPDPDPPPPRTIVLPALAESWEVEYRDAPGNRTTGSTVLPGKIQVFGTATDDACRKAVLRQWLALRAREALLHLLADAAAETGLCYSRLTVRNQRSRWGSCSAAGAISLNCKLLFLEPDLVHYVLLHELCHTREHNHTARFWNLLRQHTPDLEGLHERMRNAWQQIPPWAHPVRNHARTTGPSGASPWNR
jgi:predicted metal-dependent hydrolase